MLTTIFLPPADGQPQSPAQKMVAGAAMKIPGVESNRRQQREKPGERNRRSLHYAALRPG